MPWQRTVIASFHASSPSATPFEPRVCLRPPGTLFFLTCECDQEAETFDFIFADEQLRVVAMPMSRTLAHLLAFVHAAALGASQSATAGTLLREYFALSAAPPMHVLLTSIEAFAIECGAGSLVAAARGVTGLSPATSRLNMNAPFETMTADVLFPVRETIDGVLTAAEAMESAKRTAGGTAATAPHPITARCNYDTRERDACCRPVQPTVDSLAASVCHAVRELWDGATAAGWAAGVRATFFMRAADDLMCLAEGYPEGSVPSDVLVAAAELIMRSHAPVAAT
jgi:hypothetical protein